MITSLEDKIKITQIVICIPKNDKTIDQFHDCKKVACSYLQLFVSIRGTSLLFQTNNYYCGSTYISMTLEK
jgi:hypothetical protein